MSYLSPTATASRILRYSAWGPSLKRTSRVAFVLQYRCASAPDSHRIPFSSIRLKNHYIQMKTKAKAQYMGTHGMSR